jgi:hypothetical protein
MDVEAIAGVTAGAGEPLGMEQLEELQAATLLVHQVDDREVHEVVPKEIKSSEAGWPGEQNRTWLKRADHLIGYMSRILFARSSSSAHGE